MHFVERRISFRSISKEKAKEEFWNEKQSKSSQSFSRLVESVFASVGDVFFSLSLLLPSSVRCLLLIYCLFATKWPTIGWTCLTNIHGKERRRLIDQLHISSQCFSFFWFVSRKRRRKWEQTLRVTCLDWLVCDHYSWWCYSINQ